MDPLADQLTGLYPQEEARAIVRWLREDVRDEAALKACMARLKTGEPLQYVLGYGWFFGRNFNVNPSVLIPRQETELLVDEAIREVKRRFAHLDRPVRVLDLCTGSGCIAWTMALELPGVQVTAVDISDKALETAQTQPFDAPVRFVKADVLDTDSFPDLGQFDVILSNPPYIRQSEKALMHRNVLEHEPALALFVEDDDPLVFYRAVEKLCTRFMVEGGFGIVEINEAFGGPVSTIFAQAGFGQVRVISDFCSKDRHIFFSK